MDQRKRAICDSLGVKSILNYSWGLEAYIYKMFMSFVDPCINTDSGRPGDTFAVADDQSSSQMIQLSMLHIHICFQQNIISAIVPRWLDIEI